MVNQYLLSYLSNVEQGLGINFHHMQKLNLAPYAIIESIPANGLKYSVLTTNVLFYGPGNWF